MLTVSLKVLARRSSLGLGEFAQAIGRLDEPAEGELGCELVGAVTELGEVLVLFEGEEGRGRGWTRGGPSSCRSLRRLSQGGVTPVRNEF